MSVLKNYMETYNRDHQHPVNRALHSVGIPMIVASLGILPFNPLLGSSLFVFGWILQFVGHAFEGKAPSFFRDPTFLLIGPMWFWKKLRGTATPADPGAIS
ncbi:MAG: DUF962 domain-containing protein [Kofleriaceae bacterium]|nr:DUF962 domain-containing protein [Myxococcales bacterium]MCB9565252.1 DUF962 domain-containing protein [Kofleriaceae bacterium]MCB9572385.1 DUF962 domain-containing protein [Kofleriaceae bacterium]